MLDYNALPVWDGRVGFYQYDPEDIASWEMRIAPDGTIYYKTHEEKPQANIWCPASRLLGHLAHLYRMGVNVEVVR